MEDFKSILREARARCKYLDNYYISKKSMKYKDSFLTLYPFTTELISAYINYFDLKNRSLLTVGSSGDQVLNAALKGSRDITLIDVNSFCKYYYYLKVAALLTLKLEDYLDFLCLKNYPEREMINKRAFSIKIYQKIRIALREIDEETLEFWDRLFADFAPEIIRRAVFNDDEDRLRILKAKNPYLEKKAYEKLRKVVMDAKVTFVDQDVVDAKLDRKFDNIWLSNIGIFLRPYQRQMMFDTMDGLLEDGGRMLFTYAYGPTDTDYRNDASYRRVLRNEFQDYPFRDVRFSGINDMIKADGSKDCAIIYKRP